MKTRMRIGVAMRVALLVALGLAFSVQTAQDLFEQALSKERVEGNLKEAIALYQKAIEQSKDESLAAKAQLQIGFCLEKLGMQEAEKAFKLVIEKYPGQAEAVRQAREELEKYAAAASPVPSSGLTLRKLDIPKGIPSPDGKYISTSEEGTDLFLYEIATGKNTILRKSEKSEFLMSHVLWTPDSARFAYVWGSTREIDSLHVWTVADAKTARVFERDGTVFLNLVGWSPDLKEIFVQIRKDKVRSLARISVQTGTLVDILADDKPSPDMALSPDGRYIAYNYSTNTKDQDIRRITVDGKNQSVLFKCQGPEWLLGWTPEGDSILFSSRRAGSSGFWLQGIREGKPDGEPKLVASFDGDIYYAKMTRKGTLYYEVLKSVSDAFTAKIDFQTGKTILAPQKVESSTVGRTTSPIWSSDGAFLGYFFRKNAAASAFGRYDTFKILDQKTGETREIPLDFDAQPDYMQLPRWSKDGRFVHMLGAKSGKQGLLRFNVETGRSEILADDAGIGAWSTDGSVVFILDPARPQKLSEMQRKLVRKDIKSGENKVLYQGAIGEMLNWIKLSPDEGFVGISSSQFDAGGFNDRSVRLIPANSEVSMTKASALSFSPASAFYNWTYDGKGMIHAIVSENNPAIKLLFYPKMDPSLSPVTLELNLSSANIAFHPDGKTIAYTGQSSISEFWAMENFLPKK